VLIHAQCIFANNVTGTTLCSKKVTPFLKQLLLRNYEVDFVEICNVYVRKMIIKAAKRVFNSDKICRSYSDMKFGVTFFVTQCI